MDKKNISNILEYDLYQQSPLIHFQHNEEGATLRGSEVKPKLDKFLLEFHEELGTGENGYLIGDTKALNYKISIKATDIAIKSDIGNTEKRKRKENNRRLKPSKPISELYFGNMGRKDDEILETVTYRAPIKLRFISKHKEILEKIDEEIKSFFLLHNFGARQSKGFGSFYPIDKGEEFCSGNYEEYKENLLRRFNNSISYFFVKEIEKQGFDYIKDIYALMKMGYNPSWVKGDRAYYRAYIYKYFHEKQTGNEKALLKHKQIVPVISEDKNRQFKSVNENGRNYYLRALLGLAGSLSYINYKNERPKRVEISVESKEFERFQSMILFKPIGSYVFILPFDLDERIYNKSFKFINGKKSISINTPKLEEFNISCFIKSFTNYYNGLENKKVKGQLGIIKDNVKLMEVINE